MNLTDEELDALADRLMRSRAAHEPEWRKAWRAVAWARQMVEFGKWTREEAKAHVDEAKRKHGGANPPGV